MEFIEKRASELYTCSSGLSKSADQFGFGYPFLSYKDIFHNYYVPDELETLVNSTDKERDTCSVRRGDVFLTRTSETTDELGMSCVALKTIENATFNGFAKRLRPITEEIVPEYAAYFFRSPYFRAQCMSMASLITRASLNEGMIGRFKIRYPKDKKDQIIIGEILNNYDEAIRVNEKRIQVLESLVERVYRDWIIKSNAPGMNIKATVEQNPKGWVVSTQKKMSIPETWHFGELKELGEFVRGKNITAAQMVPGDIPVISAGLEPSGFHNKSNVEGKSITISASGANAGFLKYHLSDIWAADCSYYQNDRNIWFVYCSLKFLQPVLSNLQCGAAQPHVYPKNINRLQIVIPTVDVIEQFCDIVNPVFTEIGILRKKNELILNQRDLLLPRLLSGRLTV
ncbi:MAG: restriction endonuclease subunit S [Dorea sp.]|nr:restriction endonuclease subunit S [Dorea sp.]